MSPDPLLGFEDFLLRFRDVTERKWRDLQDPALEVFPPVLWRRGTKWTGGLSDAEIDAVEQRYDLSFRPDHRLFLRVLHTTTMPERTIAHLPDGGTELIDAPGFYDWQNDEAEIRRRLRLPIERLDIDEIATISDPYWPAVWGSPPPTGGARRQQLAERLAAAPRLVPIFGHRYVVGGGGDTAAVLSVVDYDIIIMAPDLETYLLKELGDLIGDEEMDVPMRPWQQEIPFWGGLIELLSSC
ncbi:MAG: hypothetical protein ACR2F6_12465 [Mycobacteriales bacterium]